MPWFEVQLEVPEELKDSVINRLFELGAEGVDESDPKGKTIRGSFDEKKRAHVEKELPAFLSSLSQWFPKAPKVKVEWLKVTAENWADNYKKFYRPQKLSEGFFLRPAWESPAVVPVGMIPVVMEAGQAFGTGLHPSTKLVIRSVERMMTYWQPASKIALLDVGTGTGILAIVAAKLGVERITAIDVDPYSVETARENFERNDCKGIEASDTPIAKLKGPFQLILSNILLETHRELAKDYWRLLPEGGQIILSGLLTHQVREVDELFQSLGFVFEGSSTLQEWAALCYTKGAAARR